MLMQQKCCLKDLDQKYNTSIRKGTKVSKSILVGKKLPQVLVNQFAVEMLSLMKVPQYHMGMTLLKSIHAYLMDTSLAEDLIKSNFKLSREQVMQATHKSKIEQNDFSVRTIRKYKKMLLRSHDIRIKDLIEDPEEIKLIIKVPEMQENGKYVLIEKQIKIDQSELFSIRQKAYKLQTSTKVRSSSKHNNDRLIDFRDFLNILSSAIVMANELEFVKMPNRVHLRRRLIEENQEETYQTLVKSNFRTYRQILSLVCENMLEGLGISPAVF